jgi:ribosomal protein S18 acetylase RimI-like enzyme
MNEPTYRTGNRDEIKRFCLRWEADAAKNAMLFPSCVYDYWEQSDQFLVAELDSKMVGFASFREGKPSHLDVVAVSPEFRHRGIGYELANRIATRLVEAGFVPIFWENADLEDHMESIVKKSPYAAHMQRTYG